MDIKTFLEPLVFKPKKYLGQNFLMDKKILEKIIETADLKRNDIVLEVGPGYGNLTERLAKHVSKVIAVEKDKQLVEVLKKKFSEQKNIEIIEDDILKIFNLQSSISNLKYKIVANIPYYITSRFLRLLLEGKQKPELIILLVQKEVAKRICAQKGQSSILSLSVQYYGKPQILDFVSKEAFYPAPEVDSAILKIKTYQKLPYQIENEKLFFSIIKVVFKSRRKQLINSLVDGLKISKNEVKNILEKCKILPAVRPQDLGLDDFKKLYCVIHKIIFEKR